MNLAQSYDLFLNEKKVNCTDKTIVYYKENLARFIKYLEHHFSRAAPDISVAEISKADLNDYILYLRSCTKFQEHAQVHTSEQLLKNTTINTYFRAVKAFFSWLYDEELIDKNITRKIKLPKKDPDVIIPLFRSEVESIDALLNPDTELGLRNWCIVHLMLDAAFRQIEVLRLKISDVHFDKHVLHVFGKGNKYRIVPLCPRLQDMLLKYILKYRARADPDEPFFIQVDSDKYITDTTLKQTFRKLKVQTGIDRLHMHLLRHTFATSYVMGGGNLEYLRIILGHSDLYITINYLHLAAQYNIAGFDVYQLDKFFFKSFY